MYNSKLVGSDINKKASCGGPSEPRLQEKKSQFERGQIIFNKICLNTVLFW